MTAPDHSTESYPPPFASPTNLHLGSWNIFDPVPEKYQNYFDVVHIRFVLSLLHKGGKEIVSRNLASMLKPGGWVQWQEAEAPCTTPIDLKTFNPIPRSEWPLPITFSDNVTGGIWDALAFLSHLDNVIKESGGFEATEMFRPPIKKELLKYECDLSQWLYAEILRGGLDGAMASEEGRKMKARAEQALAEEWDMISRGERCWAYCLVVAIGRKPRDS